jgi:hypothetical protein
VNKESPHLPNPHPIEDIGIDIRVEADPTEIGEIKSDYDPHEPNFIVESVGGVDFDPTEDIVVIDPEAVGGGWEPDKG